MTATLDRAADDARREVRLGAADLTVAAERALAAAPDAGGTTARILRVFAIALGVSIVLFAALLTGPIVEQWPASSPWWNLTAVIMVGAAGVALVVAGLDGVPRRIQRTAGWVAVAYLVVAALQPLAMLAPVPEGSTPWVTNLAAVAAAAASIAVRPTVAWAYLSLAGVAVAIVRWWCGAEQSAIAGLQNGAQAVAFSSMFLLFGLALVRAGRTADSAIGDARRQRSEVASRRARRDVVERINALIHDRVLATLLLAGRAVAAADREVAARSADDALTALERQRDEDEPRLTPRELVWTAQALVRDLDPDTQFGYELVARPRADDRESARGAGASAGAGEADGLGIGEIPADVGDAIAAATLEALRNSLRHADRPGPGRTNRAVHLAASGDHIVATVLDDGVGFEATRVDEARLGISSSIRGRMAAIGGTAQVVSVVGQGTRVVLTWDRAAAAASAAERAAEDAAPERPWRRRRRVSPLDMDFWIGPAPGALEAAGGAGVVRAGDSDARGAGGTRVPVGGVAAAGADRPGRADASLSADGGAPRSAPRRDDVATARARTTLVRRIQREPLLVFAALQVASNVLLAITSELTGAIGAASWAGVAGLAVYVVAAACLSLPSGAPLQRTATHAVVAATTAVTVFMSLAVSPTAGYAAWHLGANTLLLTALAVRGRTGSAWLGMALMIAITALWPRGEPLAAATLMGLFDRNVATLLVGTVASLALKRTIGRTLAIERVLDEQAADEAATAAAIEERELVLRRFEASALPVLREIAAGGETDAEHRRSWLATEAELRDRIRARSLDVEPLRGAVQRARSRGVRVVVLDDTGGRYAASAALRAPLAWAAEHLADALVGDVTVRLRAAGDGDLVLSIAGAHLHERRISLDRDEAATSAA